jgi:hypothetical protein
MFLGSSQYLTTLSPSSYQPQPPAVSRACPGLYRDTFKNNDINIDIYLYKNEFANYNFMYFNGLKIIT